MAGCLAAFLVAYLSPVTAVHADPGLALLASQALLDHGSLRLDPYLDAPELAYDLEDDYRVVRYPDAAYHLWVGVPILSLPFVWLANLFGYHMLDQQAEFALQNLLSALSCAAVFALLYALGRVYLAPVPSLAIAAVTSFGSPLVSTLGSALWNTAYAAIFLALALRHLARRDAGILTRLNLPYLALLATGAFVSRPATGLGIVAGLVYLAGEPNRWLRRTAALLVGLIGLFVAVAWLDLIEWLPPYYSPIKLRPQAPLTTGLPGILLSPSRGLLIFCPFLVVVLWGVLRAGLWRERLARFAGLWIALHLLAVAVRGKWWGGHSFGPRLLTELLLPCALLTILAWHRLAPRLDLRGRHAWAGAYLGLGLVAVWIHSIQGLWNPAVWRWNERPDVDAHVAAIFDWRYPQFLASERALDRRLVEHQRRHAVPYVLGQEAAIRSPALVFDRWYQAETPAAGTGSGWRWSRGRHAALLLELGALEHPGPYLLEIEAGALGSQTVGLSVNGTPVAKLALDGFAPVHKRIVIDRRLLRPRAENTIGFDVPSAARTPRDERVMGVALRSIRLSVAPRTPVR